MPVSSIHYKSVMIVRVTINMKLSQSLLLLKLKSPYPVMDDGQISYITKILFYINS
jgi:hypothetical protein